MSIDLKKSENNNYNKLTLNIDGEAMTLVFKNGGDIKNPMQHQALAGGGYSSTGLYQEWTCEGEVTLQKDLFLWFLNAYQNGKKSLSNTAIHKTYSSGGDVMRISKFKNVILKNMPTLQLESLGSMVSLHLSFSLNDFDGVQLQ